MNTPDYAEIWNKFKNGDEGYDIDCYDGEAIHKSCDRYKARYDKRQFTQSLGRLVQKLKKQIEAEDSAPAAAPRNATKPASSPITAGIPVGYSEYSGNDEFELNLPHHLFGWKDSNGDDRQTLMVYLPPGINKGELKPRIEAGGTEVVMEMLWPKIMTSHLLPMYAGTSNGKRFYPAGHVKVVSFRECVRRIKGGADTNQVYSVFRKNLGLEAEEQFCNFDVPSAMSAVKYSVGNEDGSATQEALCIVLEIMCRRSNYKQQVAIAEFVVDFENLGI